MSRPVNWRQVWEQRSKAARSDFQLDRGRKPHDQETENISEEQLVNFIDPGATETLLDAGCGTGVNILRLGSRVTKIIGMDYSLGSLGRCRRTIQENGIRNAEIYAASVTAIPLPDRCVDRILCMSVLQYLDEREVRRTIREFLRVLAPGGTIILHVKNFSSLYWLTLRPAKKAIAFFRGRAQIEYVRRFQWYVDELTRLGCAVREYDSYNLLTFDLMPERLVSAVRGFEIRHHNGAFFRSRFVRRHGAELLLKADVVGANTSTKHQISAVTSQA